MDELSQHLNDFDKFANQFEELIEKINFKTVPVDSLKELNNLKASLSVWEEKLRVKSLISI